MKVHVYFANVLNYPKIYRSLFIMGWGVSKLCHVLQHYFSSTFQQTNIIFLSQQISISINISQISANFLGNKYL
jgi:hypothetical protein